MLNQTIDAAQIVGAIMLTLAVGVGIWLAVEWWRSRRPALPAPDPQHTISFDETHEWTAERLNQLHRMLEDLGFELQPWQADIVAKMSTRCAGRTVAEQLPYAQQSDFAPVRLNTWVGSRVHPLTSFNVKHNPHTVTATMDSDTAIELAQAWSDWHKADITRELARPSFAQEADRLNFHALQIRLAHPIPPNNPADQNPWPTRPKLNATKMWVAGLEAPLVPATLENHTITVDQEALKAGIDTAFGHTHVDESITVEWEFEPHPGMEPQKASLVVEMTY